MYLKCVTLPLKKKNLKKKNYLSKYISHEY